MKKTFFVLLSCLISIGSIAQIKFESGYFIDNEGVKTECLIKNIEWRNNPTEFYYKKDENEGPKVAIMQNVQEFGIYNDSKYKRHTVNIDRSSDKTNLLSTQRMPEFNKEQLFLKVLVEGKATLYSYNDGNLYRFFYQVDGKEVQQLIFKKYKYPGGKVGVNVGYKQQLINDLKCPQIMERDIIKVDYYQNELVKLFNTYNTCQDSSSQDFVNIQDRDMFRLTIRPAFRIPSLSMYNAYDNSNSNNFEMNIRPSIGLEAEFVLSYNKNKWSVIVEPTYQHYETKGTYRLHSYSSSRTVNINYKSIELPVGLRHYFFLNDDAKIFIDGTFVVDKAIMGSNVDFGNTNKLTIKSRSNFALGIGYNYKNKISIQTRYYFKRDLLGDFKYWRADYSNIAFIFGYTIF